MWWIYTRNAINIHKEFDKYTQGMWWIYTRNDKYTQGMW